MPTPRVRPGVKGKHSTDVQRQGSDDGGRAALPEREDALLLHDPREGVDHVLVVPALGRRKRSVVLHADQGQVGRVADDRADEAGAQGTDGLLAEGQGL